MRAARSPLFLCGVVLLSQTFPLPSPVRDAATGAWPAGFSLNLPPLYMVFAPFCGVADRLSLLSYHQILIFMAYLILALILGLGPRRASVMLLGFLAFLVWV